MKRYLTLIILTLSHFAIGQKTNIDSLINVSQTTKDDTIKARTFSTLPKHINKKELILLIQQNLPKNL